MTACAKTLQKRDLFVGERADLLAEHCKRSKKTVIVLAQWYPKHRARSTQLDQGLPCWTSISVFDRNVGNVREQFSLHDAVEHGSALGTDRCP